MTNKQKDFEISIISGVEGYCISLNDHRIAGPKPWGGGKVIVTGRVSLKRIEEALNRKFKKE